MNSFSLLRAAAVCAIALPAIAQSQLVLPPNHHFTETVALTNGFGSVNFWRNLGGRFQVLYEGSNFTGVNGVSGPILVTKLKFRHEDGEPNLGGHAWSGVTVEVGSTSLTNANLSATFATNRTPVAPNTTTMGTLGTVNVTMAPALGGTPNNYTVEIDLLAAGASFLFDPTSAEPNLLIDISMPTGAVYPAATGAPGAIQDTTGTTAAIGGRSVYAAVGAALGSLGNPPVIGLEFAGSGGFVNPLPATNEFYGAGCGGQASTFYQAFLQGQAFDLQQGLTLIPDNVVAPNFYLVNGGSAAFDASKVNAAPNSIADDAVVTHALGYTFAFPGGSTATIKPCTNGFVWLDGVSTSSDFTPTLAELLGTTLTTSVARLLPMWTDLHSGRNTATHPNSGLHVLNDTSGGVGNTVTYITWFNTGLFNSVSGLAVGGHVVMDMQVVLYEASGIVEFRYGAVPPFCQSSIEFAAVTGFTRGRIAGVGSVDPASRDLSHEVPFATAPEGAVGNMRITSVSTPEVGTATYGGRMFPGQSVKWNVSNVPPGSVFGAQLLDIASSQPGLQLPTITAPGCMLSTSTGALIWELTVLPPASVVGTVPLVVPAGVMGAQIHAQYIVIDLVGPNLIASSSNALRSTIGLD